MHEPDQLASPAKSIPSPYLTEVCQIVKKLPSVLGGAAEGSRSSLVATSADMVASQISSLPHKLDKCIYD